MTSSFEENQTSLIEEFSSIYLNDSCEPDCHTLSKPNPFDEDLPTQILISFALIFVLASISIAVIFHRLEKKCSNEQKRRNELNQVRKRFFSLEREEGFVLFDVE